MRKSKLLEMDCLSTWRRGSLFSDLRTIKSKRQLLSPPNCIFRSMSSKHHSREAPKKCNMCIFLRKLFQSKLLSIHQSALWPKLHLYCPNNRFKIFGKTIDCPKNQDVCIIESARTVSCIVIIFAFQFLQS